MLKILYLILTLNICSVDSYCYNKRECQLRRSTVMFGRRNIQDFKRSKSNIYNIIQLQDIQPVFLKSVAAYCALISFTNFAINNAPFSNSFYNIPVAYSANLPTDNGASGNQRGATSSLIPILKLSNEIDKTLEKLTSSSDFVDLVNQDISKAIYFSLDLSEKSFKRLFDEYSDGVSYKQQYLDKNAFLVYYTQGFDGPNRDNIEADTDGSMTRMSLQYGYRNDAWVNLDNAISEIRYLQQQSIRSSSSVSTSLSSDLIEESKTDLILALKSTKAAFTQYLSLAPKSQILEALTKL